VLLHTKVVECVFENRLNEKLSGHSASNKRRGLKTINTNSVSPNLLLSYTYLVGQQMKTVYPKELLTSLGFCFL